MKRTPLSLAMSFPLPGQTRDFHPLEPCAARRTVKNRSDLSSNRFCRKNHFLFLHPQILFPTQFGIIHTIHSETPKNTAYISFHIISKYPFVKNSLFSP